MEKRVCEVCGEEFEPRRKDQRGCSPRCAHMLYKREKRAYMRMRRGCQGHETIAETFAELEPVPLSQLMSAKRKPKNTSATRWRMELARRADPIRFALAGVAVR